MLQNSTTFLWFYTRKKNIHSRMKMPNLSAKNPLGIIALFISLIYGMSALLLGTSVDSLLDHNQTILVCFIVLFPVIVLIAFTWLVSKHHRKLYAPRDYQSDKGFLEAIIADSPKSIGKKYAEDLDELPDDQTPRTENALGDGDEAEFKADTPSDQNVADDGKKKSEKTNQKNKEQSYAPRNNLLKEGYIAENLVFQELQNEYRSPVRTNVKYRDTKTGHYAHVDGLIQSPNGPIIVEVKLIHYNSYFKRRVREAVEQVKRYRDMLAGGYNMPPNTIVAIVVVGNRDHFDKVQTSLKKQNQQTQDQDLQLKAYWFNELIEKYGFSNKD